MTFADQIDDPRARCRPQLLRLRMLAHSETGEALPRQAAAEVREATNAVIAESEAAGQAALAATGGPESDIAAGTFLWVRLARLAEAADKAVAAARAGDVNGLRRHLDRFDALASAIWTVQDAVYGQVPLPRPGARRP
jgi:hypothetical protein